MKILCACSSYWNSRDEFLARYNGVWINEIDPITGNRAYYLNPAYNGRFGLKTWHAEMARFFNPAHSFIACGTWSDPDFAKEAFGNVVSVVNSGVLPERPHSNGWQYMGAALTATMAYALNWGPWDVLIFLEPDILIGAVDWDSVLREFAQRPEEVFGATWYAVHCDMIGFKRRGAVRYLHQRTRPNLTEDESVPWLDHEIAEMFNGRAWNPFPQMPTCRQDFFHEASPHPSNEEVMKWPLLRMPDPRIVDRYVAENNSIACPVKQV